MSGNLPHLQFVSELRRDSATGGEVAKTTAMKCAQEKRGKFTWAELMMLSACMGE